MRQTLSSACLAAIFALAATTQTAKPIATWANLNQLTAGAEIRVTLADGRMVRGFLQGVTPESLAINAPTSQETLARSDVRRVALKKESRRGRHTLIGLAIGAGAGLAAGAGLDSQSPGYWFPNVGKAVFAPVGAIIGTVIGVALPTGGWREVYRAP